MKFSSTNGIEYGRDGRGLGGAWLDTRGYETRNAEREQERVAILQLYFSLAPSSDHIFFSSAVLASGAKFTPQNVGSVSMN